MRFFLLAQPSQFATLCLDNLLMSLESRRGKVLRYVFFVSNLFSVISLVKTVHYIAVTVNQLSYHQGFSLCFFQQHLYLISWNESWGNCARDICNAEVSSLCPEFKLLHFKLLFDENCSLAIYMLAFLIIKANTVCDSYNWWNIQTECCSVKNLKFDRCQLQITDVLYEIMKMLMKISTSSNIIFWLIFSEN